MKSCYLLIATSLLAVIGQIDSATAEERPNILFAIADDWSFGHAGAYGCNWVRTPNFDRVAREGVLFNRAYTPNAKCAPSRATILTGRYSWQLEEAGNHLCNFPPKFGSFVERLAAAGYSTGFTGKGWGPGIAKDVNGKRRKITGVSYAKRKAKPPAKGISSNDYAGNFGDFLAQSPKDQPWVFWYGTTEPHRGYEFKSGVRLGKQLSDIEHVPSYWPDNETTRHDMLDYAIEVEHYDTHLGKILKAIEAAGQLENTLIVATSDHGMPFPRVKGQAYEASNHIPLAMRWPAGIKGKLRVVEDVVNFTDLAPTFLQAAGVTEPGPIMQPPSGRSLFDIFASTSSGQITADRDHVIVGKERHDVGRPETVGYPIRGIHLGNLLYIRNYETDRWPAGNPETGYLNCDASPIKSQVLDMRRSGKNKDFWNMNFGKRPAEELYDLSADPDCVHNLATTEKYADEMETLRSRMIADLKAQGDPRMFGQGDLFDKYPVTGNPRYYERYMSGEKVKAGWVLPTDYETKPLD